MEKEILGEGGKFEEGREIVDKVNAEENAQKLIDLISERNEKERGSGLEDLGELGADSSAERKSFAKELIEKVADETEKAEELYQLISGYVEKGKESNLDGKKLIEVLARKKQLEKLTSSVEQTKDFIKDTDWGRLLIEIAEYLERKEKKDRGKIEIEVFPEGE